MTEKESPKPVRITIRNVPDAVRDELASRAALEGKSLQRYLLDLLERNVKFPTEAMLMAEFRKRNRAAGARGSAEEIRNAGDADRR